MKRRVHWTALLLLSPLAAPAQGPLERGFRSPPPQCRPGVFMAWMGGNLSKEGLTKDLEALAREGVGGVLVMQMPDQLAGVTQWPFRDYPGKVQCLSDEWYATVNHAIGECDRLGLTFSALPCAGWSHVGGPWVTPRRASRSWWVSGPKSGARVASRTSSPAPRSPPRRSRDDPSPGRRRE